ncbi:MAG: trigger factor [Clostridia bacterium]|jgi:trigger factor|nr:trigger factor [Clostridia bacterium]
MKTNVEKLENNLVKITIEASKEMFNEGIEASYKKNRNKFDIKGFRKGKVSMKVIERTYGESVFFEDAFNYVFSKAYPKAVEENNLYVVSRAEIEEVKQIGKDKDLIFTVIVTVKPEVELGNYKGVEYKAKAVRVSAKEIDEKLELDREKNARVVDVTDRAAQDADIVSVDFEGFVDGVAFEGGKGENYSLTLGSKTFIDTFEEQIVGKKIGEEFEVSVKFPKEYHVEDLAGKPATFKVKLNEIKMKELPELNDDFAKDISEFDTIDELKADVKEKIREEKKHAAEHEKEEAIIDEILKESKMDVPAVMVDNRTDYLVSNFENRLKYQGINLAQYLQMLGKSMEEFRTSLSEDAEKQVKTGLVLDAIANAEGFEVTEKELNEEIANLAKSYNTDVKTFEKTFKGSDVEALKEDMKAKKAYELVMSSAVKK